MLEPINTKLFFLAIFLMTYLVSFDQIVILPLVKTPEDLPCQSILNSKNPICSF